MSRDERDDAIEPDDGQSDVGDEQASDGTDEERTPTLDGGTTPGRAARDAVVRLGSAYRWQIVGTVVALLAFGVFLVLMTGVPLSDLTSVEFWLGLPVEDVLTVGFAERSLQAAMPIAIAAIGGLYAEKSGVFNIGLEGFMIFGAVNAAAVTYLLAENAPTQTELWIGIVAAVLVSLVYTAVFAVLTIRYEADQIVAGLAVWFLGLGFGPFTAILLWGGPQGDPVGSIEAVAIPGLAEIPVLGRLFFDANPLLWVTIALVAASYVVLYHTRYGYWIQAAGENPEALDTAGISVRRVRYAAVMFSGAVAGLAGAVVSIGINNGFNGTGTTMVDGRGWIAIVAYLFGNYNPIFTALASLLFGAAQMLQIQLQTVGIDLPNSLMGQLPYVVVIVVLTLVGSTRVPSAVGEHYESEE